MNFYKHHIGDYDADTSHLSWVEDMAYTRLMRLYYRREQPIPGEIGQACRLVRAHSKQEQMAVENVLREFFTLESDGWHNKRCDEEILLSAELGHDREAKAANEKERQRRHRLERQRLFDELRAHDIVPAYDTTMDALRDLLRNVTKTDLSRVTGVTVTRTATAIQTPDSRLQNPDSKNQRSNPPDSVGLNGSHAAPPNDVERVFDHWRDTWGHPSAKLDTKRTKVIGAALKAYSAEQLCTAISGYRKSPHHTGSNDRSTVYDALTLLLKDHDHIDAGIKFASTQEKTTWM